MFASRTPKDSVQFGLYVPQIAFPSNKLFLNHLVGFAKMFFAEKKILLDSKSGKSQIAVKLWKEDDEMSFPSLFIWNLFSFVFEMVWYFLKHATAASIVRWEKSRLLRFFCCLGIKLSRSLLCAFTTESATYARLYKLQNRLHGKMA